MKTSNSYQTRALNALFIIFLYLVLGFYSCIAQSFQRITHKGIEGSFGIHGFKTHLNSDGTQTGALTKGVAIGFVTGNNLIKARIRPMGLYKSTSTEKRSFEILESEALLNLYPLEFLRTRKHVLDIYITTGLNFSKFKYNDRNVFLQNDVQQDEAEFLALDKATVLSQVSGIGIEYHLPFSFVHVFTEAVFANQIYASSDNCFFQQTSRQAGTTINFGIRIGNKKNVKNNQIYPN
jgi:hypothetical protein